jgi:hypothetical protein
MQKLYYRLGSGDSSGLEERWLIERYLEFVWNMCPSSYGRQ